MTRAAPATSNATSVRVRREYQGVDAEQRQYPKYDSRDADQEQAGQAAAAQTSGSFRRRLFLLFISFRISPVNNVAGRRAVPG